jgi:hypothetical protein
MTFVSENNNALRNIVELKTKVTAKEDDCDKHEVLMELRIHPNEIDDKIGTIAVEVVQAFLDVDFSGLEVVAKTKLGQPVKDLKVRREVQRERSVTTSEDHEKTGSLEGSGGVSTTGGNIQGKTKREKTDKSGESVTKKESTTDVSEFYRVCARGDDIWRISEEDNSTLDGVYIDNDPLCEVTRISGSNRVSVDAELMVKQKHLKTKLIPKRRYMDVFNTNNQQKLLNIIIAKSLHEAGSDRPFDGMLVFAKSRSIDEG